MRIMVIIWQINFTKLGNGGKYQENIFRIKHFLCFLDCLFATRNKLFSASVLRKFKTCVAKTIVRMVSANDRDICY